MRRLAVAGVLMLAACGQRSQPSGSNVVAGTPPKVAVETAGANSAANASSNETGVLPPANAAVRYVGT